MSIITHSEPDSVSSAALFIPLVSGKLRPNKLWNSQQFRLKFALRSAVFPLTTFNYLHQLAKLSFLPQLLNSQGLLPAKPHRPYLRAGFSVAQRAQAILDHYQLMDRLANNQLRQLLLSPSGNLLARFTGKNEEQFAIYCCSGHYDREGEITLLLNYQDMTLASLSFSIIQEQQQRTLLIGGLQGPRKHISSDVIRDATKAAHGVFPKRLLMEAVFILAAQCGVEAITAVGDTTHVFRSLRYRHSKGDKFFASYSEFWLSLGGEMRGDELFTLPLSMARKDLEEIASKKRAEYRRRYALLDTLAQQVLQAAGAERDVAHAA
ncbi:VirK/YbjX family protein [Pantoea dispersa]|uniref:VirK/YbjX family protein n=1 Tax=Pantoea TaxID=53335 RepID=UPI001CA6C517|nr:VirK/YbjX family protein [Pantoea dispersa]MDT8852831.1 VirK/YbjX family protein [Pantoea dispersa]QZY90455.1 VirK/YbjX family protein [Pantoea dispersa]